MTKNKLNLFEYEHNNPPAPFNPDYVEWASDVSTITTYQCYLEGVYDLPQLERIKLRREKYNTLMLLGKPKKADVKKAVDYMYNL